MVFFIFDVDDTFIIHNKENNDYYDTYNNGELKRLLKSIDIQNIYIYTNGTYSHGKNIVDNLLLDSIIPRSNIFGRDILPYMKPDIRSFNYVNHSIKNINDDTIYFFDDLIENLIVAKEVGWITIWISPNFINKPEYIDYSFPNVFQALLFFKEK